MSTPSVADAAVIAAPKASTARVPLCVDLDGTLTPVDTLHESLLGLARQAPAALWRLPLWLSQGKARLKREVASRIAFDAARLPLNPQLLGWLKEEHAQGRRLVLATAADAKIAEHVATHVGLFDQVIASNGESNLSAETKTAALVKHFGMRGFDYVGNESTDEPVWAAANKAIVVGGSRQAERASRVAQVERVFPGPNSTAMTWIKAMRLHQWVKNVLIFLPALLAHKILMPAVLFKSVLAFVAFGLCASSVYLINDLLDLTADRHHPRKRMRPFASGALSAQSGLAAAFALLLSGAALAVLVNWQFAGVLAGYYVLTWTYSLRLKRAALVDVMTLAGLYTIRIIAGAAATAIPLSFWLLAFSIFIFLSLGFVKRYTELDDARQEGGAENRGRGYRPADLPLLMNLGIAAGYCTVVVMALYINSTDSQSLYRHNKPLWLVCPLLLYWISRIWLLTTRGQMHDDPVVFALRDRMSLLVLGLVGLFVLLSI
ncbi:MAG TPA: UbiA family prenyltransferase [Steroidobacteraceae bacterium]|nr:UbiA family prenyltransferase [Steroidobacteraceae bacterium]